LTEAVCQVIGLPRRTFDYRASEAGGKGDDSET
jgi:hypothetical protein